MTEQETSPSIVTVVKYKENTMGSAYSSEEEDKSKHKSLGKYSLNEMGREDNTKIDLS
jgi:hypothetical protein